MLHHHGPGSTAVQTPAEVVSCRLRFRTLPCARHASMPVVQRAAVTCPSRSYSRHMLPDAGRPGAASRRPFHRRRQRTIVQCLKQQQREETATIDTTQADVSSADTGIDSNRAVLADDDGSQQQQRRLQLFDAKRDIRRRVQEFRYSVPVADGMLEVRPLTGGEVQATTDLLTEVFATLGGPGWNVYTRYMRNQIRKFLETQLELPPDAVVLIAVLHPADDMGTSASRPQAELPSWQAASASSASGQNGASAAGGERAPASQPASISKPGLAVSPASDGSGAADAEVAAANGVYYPSPVPQDKDDEPGQVQREAATDDDLLVGTFEVAFTEAARTKELTLNPPSDGAYLSNMCTAPEHRRLGYGAHMLTAAEHLTRMTAYRKIYLHNRLQDKPATALYQSLGYEVIKQDCVLWGLLGQDRRYLMSKAVPADTTDLEDIRTEQDLMLQIDPACQE